MSEQIPPVPPVGLSATNLSAPKEGTYFTFVLILSILFWIVLVISIAGIFYALLFAFMLWIGNGLLVAHLRAEAVKVSERQLPQLHAAFRQVCESQAVIGDQVPDLYVIQAGGLLNAFATRFCGRDFVVVYSDLLEAIGPASAEMKFLLGHELGHIKSRHILKSIFLGPGMFFPLIGPAYRRAWETSCDRFGAFAAQDVDASVRAMLILGGGREHGRHLSAEVFASQHTEDRGFFVSLHEITSTYPTLTRRVTDLLALKTGNPARAADRNPFAYFLAFFMPGGQMAGGGAASMMIIIVMIGMMAAMAIPAFQKVRQSSLLKVCANNQLMLEGALDQYRMENNAGVKNWSDIVGDEKLLPTMPVCSDKGTYSASYDPTAESYTVTCSKHGHLDPTSATRSR